MSEIIYKDPNRFYVYAFLREDGPPSYIGKGTAERAWSRNRTILPPKEKERIVLLKENLSEQEAFEHEIEIIKLHGRKNIDTGILWNLTDGGEGTSGWVASKLKFSLARQGENNPMYGQTHTQETLDKMSACKVGENHPRFGKKFPHSEATKEKIR